MSHGLPWDTGDIEPSAILSNGRVRLRIASVGNAADAAEDAEFIVHAVNRQPDYEAAADALESLLTHAVPHLRGETSPTAMQSDPRLWSSVQKGRATLRRLRGDA